MTLTGRAFSFAFLALLAAGSVAAQQTDAERIQKLEERVEELMRQVTALQTEIHSLKTPAEPSLADVQPIEPVAPAATAGKPLNPDIAAIGTFVGRAGGQNPFEERPPFDFEEAEISLEAFIDPYAKGRLFLAVGPEGAELEEAYAQFVTLPYGLTAKAGKVKAIFGKANSWHTHQRPWVDQPLVISRFFGDEGLTDSGVSVSKSIDNPWNAFIEVTGEVMSGDVEDVFARESSNDLLYNTHLKFFRDISENSNIEIGTSWAQGTLDGDANRFGGVDVTYRWKPLARSIYNSLIARFEGIANRRGSENLTGFYASADYQLARRWFAGVRLDRAETDFSTDRGVSALVTFWPSEFSQLRGQFRRTRYGELDAVNEFLLQLQFSIGAHGAHTF